MMMERAKTAPAPEPPTQANGDASKSEPTAPKVAQPAPAANASAEERVQDLERRLEGLGGESAAAAAAAPAAAPKQQQTGKNNPLLKRIQAAQERARLAEQREKEEQAAAELARQQKEAEEANAKAAEEERIAKAQSALRSVAGRALEDKQREILAQLEGKSPVAPTSPGVEVSPGVPIMKTMDPPPPSFDSMQFPPPREQPNVLMPGSEEMKGHGMNSRKLTQQPTPQQAAPPSFDFVEQQLAGENVPPPPPAPTAPQISPSAPPAAAGEDHLLDVMPVAPPLLPTEAQMDGAPPPSFEAFEQQQQAQPTDTAQHNEAVDDDLFAYDENGHPLSPEQKQALLDEQRRLYESIKSEKAANDAAIAEAQADAFDMRSSNAAAAALDGGSHVARNQAMDAVGRNVEQSADGQAEGEQHAADDPRHDPRRMVKIGNNQTVALHGQDRTKRAIKEGTAVLVQCINCQNWMQVTDTATLMFCPVCQVVSPVIQQTEVMTKEEAIQLTMDRKLAEKLQAEAYGDGEERKEEGAGKQEEQGFFGKLFGAAEEAPSPSASLTAAGTRPPHADTWWDKISSIVSYGVADDGPRERGDLGVSLPPGAPSAAQYPAERRGSPAAAASGSPARHEETRGLLAPVVDGHEESLPAGRVAESKPLFSCLADSMSSAAQALYSTGEGDGQGNVHGVDASSLLVTNAGRGVGDGAGGYEQLPDRE